MPGTAAALHLLPASCAGRLLERLPSDTVSALVCSRSRVALHLAVAGLRELLPDLQRRRTPEELCRCRALCLVPTAARRIEGHLGIRKWEQRAAFALRQLRGGAAPLLEEWLLGSLRHRVFLSPARVSGAGVPEGLAEEYLRRSRHLFLQRSRGACGQERVSVPVASWAAADDGVRRFRPYQLRSVAEAAPGLGGLLEFCVRREHLGSTEPFMGAVAGMLAGGPEVRLRVV